MGGGTIDTAGGVHFTVGSLGQTSRRGRGIDFSGELGPLKAALLYADGVELISVGASFAASMDELGSLTTPDKLALLRRFLPEMDLGASPAEVAEFLRRLDTTSEKLRKRRRLSKQDVLVLTLLKEKWSGIEQVANDAMQKWGAEEFRVALSSGRLELSPFSNVSPEDIVKIGMGDSTALRPLVAETWQEYRQTVLDVVSNKATFPLFDDMSGNIVGLAIREGLIRPTSGAKRRSRHGGFSGDLLQRLPMFERASMADILDIREELSDYLGPFREGVVDLAATIESASWEADFDEEVDLVFHEKVAPAVERIEQRVEAAPDLKELTLRYGPHLLSGAAGSFGAFLAGQWALGSLAALAAGLSAVAAGRSQRDEVEGQQLYFYYRAGKRLRLRR